MQIANKRAKYPAKSAGGAAGYYRFSKWLLILLVLGVGCAQAQAPNLTYSAPLVITKGGTYTGNYRSPGSGTPAIQINTTEPVILEGCNLTGPGDMIYAGNSGSDITVRNCSGYTTDPTVDNQERGKFIIVNQGKNLVVEHNYLERSKGIIVHLWSGNGSDGQALRVRYNNARNIDGRIRNGAPKATGWANFFQMDKCYRVANAEIAWNQIVNDPNISSVGDGINFYNSSGTPASPIQVHDNYYQGSYPTPANNKEFNGTGMCIDGTPDATASTASGYIVASYNQFVSTCNGGINISAGHHVLLDHNRVVTSGYLPDGSKLQKHYAGIQNWNYYNQAAGVYGSNLITNNTIGYINHDSWQPKNIDLATPGATVSGNVDLPLPITLATERNELTLWQQKLKQNNVTPGPLTGPGSTVLALTPTPTSPTPPAPTTSTASTFYRAFNINGPAVIIDGNQWEAGSAMQATGNTFANQGVPLVPATDARRASMIRASTYGKHVKLTVGGVPNATYQVYLYVWEDNNAENFSISVNGQLVKSTYNSGAAGHWDRIGPYAATVTSGAITVNTDGGDANCSGLELWRAGAAAPAPTPPQPVVPAGGGSVFYRAINLNGAAATIDGNGWEGSAAPNYTVNGFRFSSQGQPLTPATDAARATMLRSAQTSTGLDFRLTAVPAGTYQVYVYVWEDNYPENYAIAVNGQPAAKNLSSGAAGSWARRGPYAAEVTNGTLQVAVGGGNVNTSGIEVWSVNSLAGPGPARATAGPATALYPNPVSGQQLVQVSATAPQAQQVQVQVLDRMGTAVLRTLLSFPLGASSQALNLGSLPQGTYVVRFIDGFLAGTTVNVVKVD